MSERKIAVVSMEFYVDGQADFEDKTLRIHEHAEEVMGCTHCDCDCDWENSDDCEEGCGHNCNLLGASSRLLSGEEFDKEFLSDE